MHELAIHARALSLVEPELSLKVVHAIKENHRPRRRPKANSPWPSPSTHHVGLDGELGPVLCLHQPKSLRH